MSDAASAALRKPDNDAHGDDGAVPIASLFAGPPPPPRSEPPAAGGMAAPGTPTDAVWRDAARAEGSKIGQLCSTHADAHFTESSRWERRNTGLGILGAVLGVLTTGTVAAVLSDTGILPAVQNPDAGTASIDLLPHFLKLGLAAATLFAALLAAAVRFLDPQGRAQQHGAAGKRYRALEDETRQFCALEITDDASRESLFNHLQTMIRHRGEINEAAPVIPRDTYVAARAKLGAATPPKAPAGRLGAVEDLQPAVGPAR